MSSTAVSEQFHTKTKQMYVKTRNPAVEGNLFTWRIEFRGSINCNYRERKKNGLLILNNVVEAWLHRSQLLIQPLIQPLLLNFFYKVYIIVNPTFDEIQLFSSELYWNEKFLWKTTIVIDRFSNVKNMDICLNLDHAKLLKIVNPTCQLVATTQIKGCWKSWKIPVLKKWPWLAN